MPLGVSEDRLLGSVDVARSIRRGAPVFQPGVLAAAHRGVLLVDEINLLERGIRDLLLTILADGTNRVEREGISFQHPCRPLLVATCNPAEADLSPHLIDRFAITLSADGALEPDERIEAVTRVLEFQNHPAAFRQRFAPGLEALRQQVVGGRARLSEVRMSAAQIRYLVEEAIRGRVEGQRVDLFSVRVARAHAALEGRTTVTADDLQQAVELVVLPRAATVEPVPPAESPPEQPVPEAESLPPPPGSAEADTEGSSREPPPPPEPQGLPESFVFSPEGVILDPGLLELARRVHRRRSREGGRGAVPSLSRGRYVRAVLPHGEIQRLAIDATVRAAAPYQKARRRRQRRRARQGRRTSRRLLLRRDDLRAKLLERRASSLVVFVVDASGSMALNRMQAAKGAVLSLLHEAYRSRDQIALIAFGGERARVLLPPTRSITAAARRLERLACGGGSPMAHGLALAVRMAQNTRLARDVGEVGIVLISDGKANVSLSRSLRHDQGSDGDVRQDLQDLALAIQALEMRLLVIDTGNRHVSSGLAEDLARRAGGHYHHLPRLPPGRMGQAIASMARGVVDSG